MSVLLLTTHVLCLPSHMFGPSAVSVPWKPYVASVIYGAYSLPTDTDLLGELPH